MACPYCNHQPVDPSADSSAVIAFYVCPACGEEWSVRWRGQTATVLLRSTHDPRVLDSYDRARRMG